MAYKRDYLRRIEIIQFLHMAYFKLLLDGNLELGPIRADGIPMCDQFMSSGIGDKDDRKNLKMVSTYLGKFFDKKMKELSDKERAKIYKKIKTSSISILEESFDRRKMKNNVVTPEDELVITRNDFYDIVSEVMNSNCRGCHKHHNECNWYKLFDSNDVPIGDFTHGKCCYSYPTHIREGENYD